MKWLLAPVRSGQVAALLRSSPHLGSVGASEGLWQASWSLKRSEENQGRPRDGQGFPEIKVGRLYREKPLKNTLGVPWGETKIPFRGIEKRSVTIKDLSKLFSNKFE